MLDFLKKVKDNIVSVLGLIIAVLLGLLWFTKSKKDAAEALNGNQEDQQKINQIDSNIAKNDGLLAAEEQKRSEIEQELKRKENEKPTDDQLLDYFNKPSDK